MYIYILKKCMLPWKVSQPFTKVLATDCIHLLPSICPRGPLNALHRLGSLWREMEK